MVTNVLHAESYWMTTGVEKITSFDPIVGQDHLQITFSVDGMTPQGHAYELKKTGKAKQNVFVFDQKVSAVELHDKELLQQTTSSTIIPTATIPTIVPSPSALMLQGNSDAIIILALTIITMAFLILVLALFFINKRRPSIYIESSINFESQKMKTTDESLDSRLSYQTTQYPMEPFNISVLMSPC
ncbi:unnamed protein product [Caenorhabditis brenneri]